MASEFLDSCQQPNVQMITVPLKRVCVCVWSDTDAHAGPPVHAAMPTHMLRACALAGRL